jgi:membrane-bound lytic murein transglycosylase D
MPVRPMISVLRTACKGLLALSAAGASLYSQSALPRNFGVSGAEPAIIAIAPSVSKTANQPPMPLFSDSAPKPAPVVAVEDLVGDAGNHFLAGKELFQRGDLQGARKEFDQAVDCLTSALAVAPDRHSLEKTFDDFLEAIHSYDVEGLGAGDQQEEVTFEKSPLEEILGLTFPIDPAMKDKVKEEVRVTASQLPLTVNDAVLSYINYFSSSRSGRATMVAGLRRAARYRPLISRILAEVGVPQELMHLAQAESGFYPRAVSRVSATGMWQFMLSRGQQYGLARTPWYDDRLDPEKATRAAARHLRDLYQEFGDWHLAMAAYNCGPLTVHRAVERTGYADFWELRNRHVLPKETCNYVPAILAMVIVAKNARDYGLTDIEGDPPMEYDSIDISAPTHLALIADAAERPASEIRELNPALLNPIAPAGYHLRLPKGTLGKAVSSLDAVPAEHRVSWRIHRVGQGETLATIAQRYTVSPSSIGAANPAGVDSVGPGDVLLIPAAFHDPTAPTRAARSRVVGRSSSRSATARRSGAHQSARHTHQTLAHKAGSHEILARRTGGRQAVAQKSVAHRNAVPARSSSTRTTLRTHSKSTSVQTAAVHRSRAAVRN